MTQVKFVRSDPKNGRFRTTPAAATFWREYGWIVGEVLRPESPLAFAEILKASREYALDYPESTPLLPLDEAYVAWCLVRLLDYGLVVPVAEGPLADRWQFDPVANIGGASDLGAGAVSLPVAFVNLFTRRRLAEAVLPTLPSAGDIVHLGRSAYEVAYSQWHVHPDNGVSVTVLVQRQKAYTRDGRIVVRQEDCHG